MKLLNLLEEKAIINTLKEDDVLINFQEAQPLELWMVAFKS